MNSPNSSNTRRLFRVKPTEMTSEAQDLSISVLISVRGHLQQKLVTRLIKGTADNQEVSKHDFFILSLLSFCSILKNVPTTQDSTD